MSPKEKLLLLALRRGRHFKNNPGNASHLLGVPAQEANPTARHLISLGYAARVTDGERPGALLVRITDAGISAADQIEFEERDLTVIERIRAIPLGKGLWDLTKVGFGALLGALGTKYFG